LYNQGYIFSSYGKLSYLRDVIITVESIRRFDKERGVALFCSEEHKEFILENNLEHFFDVIELLAPEYRSITGFKHNTHLFMVFSENLFLDSDMIFCKSPNLMWKQLEPYPYTATGVESADVFFGSHKGVRILVDIILRKRQRTLKRFGLSHLYRIQSGIIYAKDKVVTTEVNELAKSYLSQMDKTHFISRKNERGRTLDSCEWSLGMAMSKLKLFVYPWFNGYQSLQLDFITDFTKYDAEFREVECLYYCNPFIYSFRGIQQKWIRNMLIKIAGLLPKGRDHFWVTPYILHFGWKHEKETFETYAKNKWAILLKEHSTMKV